MYVTMYECTCICGCLVGGVYTTLLARVKEKAVWNQWSGMMGWNGGVEWWDGMVEWSGGMEWWSGMVGWNGGVEWWSGMEGFRNG